MAVDALRRLATPEQAEPRALASRHHSILSSGDIRQALTVLHSPAPHYCPFFCFLCFLCSRVRCWSHHHHHHYSMRAPDSDGTKSVCPQSVLTKCRSQGGGMKSHMCRTALRRRMLLYPSYVTLQFEVWRTEIVHGSRRMLIGPSANPPRHFGRPRDVVRHYSPSTVFFGGKTSSKSLS